MNSSKVHPLVSPSNNLVQFHGSKLELNSLDCLNGLFPEIDWKLKSSHLIGVCDSKNAEKVSQSLTQLGISFSLDKSKYQVCLTVPKEQVNYYILYANLMFLHAICESLQLGNGYSEIYAQILTRKKQDLVVYQFHCAIHEPKYYGNQIAQRNQNGFPGVRVYYLKERRARLYPEYKLSTAASKFIPGTIKKSQLHDIFVDQKFFHAIPSFEMLATMIKDFRNTHSATTEAKQHLNRFFSPSVFNIIGSYMEKESLFVTPDGIRFLEKYIKENKIMDKDGTLCFTFRHLFEIENHFYGKVLTNDARSSRCIIL